MPTRTLGARVGTDGVALGVESSGARRGDVADRDRAKGRAGQRDHRTMARHTRTTQMAVYTTVHTVSSLTTSIDFSLSPSSRSREGSPGVVSVDPLDADVMGVKHADERLNGAV
ncbi:hypothetical protein GCM10027059_43410 [Myceligenerans halotolerans]